MCNPKLWALPAAAAALTYVLAGCKYLQPPKPFVYDGGFQPGTKYRRSSVFNTTASLLHHLSPLESASENSWQQVQRADMGAVYVYVTERSGNLAWASIPGCIVSDQSRIWEPVEFHDVGPTSYCYRMIATRAHHDGWPQSLVVNLASRGAVRQIVVTANPSSSVPHRALHHYSNNWPSSRAVPSNGNTGVPYIPPFQKWTWLVLRGPTSRLLPPSYHATVTPAPVVWREIGSPADGSYRAVAGWYGSAVPSLGVVVAEVGVGKGARHRVDRASKLAGPLAVSWPTVSGPE